MTIMTAAPQRPTHDEAVQFVVTANALAGHDVDAETLETLGRIARGEITVDEAVAEVIAEFAEPAE
ncbi:hypothetical protein EB74_12700 [Mycobacterium sp. SWH-M5]|nr:antitoxin VbhA family protein [Mycolicibacterium goodii]OKH63612.1 hypothetical protein EB74_12700 [Mycobacterium sp. SWH-M5]